MSEELDAGARIGRFVVVRRLGEGGMGTVYEARDPELSRAVAVKVLRDRGGDAMRLLREAQALARLSHPNVVGVYELGSHDGQVFVAMERVDGVTLDAHLRGRGRAWREILALFVAAGRGLAAVHAEGLVHRDIKPSNILVDTRGRVRVGDFGLARHDDGSASHSGAGARASAVSAPSPDTQLATTIDEREPSRIAIAETITPDGLLGTPLTDAGAVVGTPRYMAPEQRDGLRVTRAADQYSFCVALWEALTGEVPRPPLRAAGIPAWLERAIARGLADDPLARWPSMTALLDLLEGVPRRRRRRAIAAAMLGAIAAATVGGVLIAGRGGARVSCDDAAIAAARAWTPSIRASVTAGLTAGGRGWAGPLAKDVDASLDAWVGRWRDVRVDACRAATERGEESAAMLDKRAACLDDQLDELRALAGALAHADAAAAAHADAAASALPAPETCTASRVSGAADVDPKTRAVDGLIAEARTALDLHSADLAARADRALAAADALARPAERARARSIHADVVVGADQPGARAEVDEAMKIVATAHDPVLEADVVMQALRMSANEAAADRTTTLLTAAQAAVARAGNPSSLEIELAKTEYTAFAQLGRVDDARAACDRLIALSSPADAELEKTTCACELALVVRHDQDALAPCRQRVADLRARLGDAHPIVADAQYNVLNALVRTGQLDDAMTAARDLIALFDRLYGPGSLDASRTLRLIGVIEDRQGKSAEALADLERALAQFDAIAPPDDPQRAAFLMEVAQREATAGKTAAAVAHADAGLDAAKRRLPADAPELSTAYVMHGKVLRNDPNLHERALDSYAHALAIAEKHADQKAYLVNVIAFYGGTLIGFERYDDALPLVERAVALYDELDDKADAAAMESEIGDALDGLHRRAAARAAYVDARARYTALGDKGKKSLAVVDAWLRSHPP